MMNKLITLIGAGAMMFLFSCKDDIDKAAECTKASTEYTNAKTAFTKDQTEANCDNQTTTAATYQEKCDGVSLDLEILGCECILAGNAYTAAEEAYGTNPSQTNCEARNAAINKYRTACGENAKALDTINCSLYDTAGNLIE